MNQAARGGRMSESAVRALRVAVHKGECASAVLNAVIVGRETADEFGFNGQIALESMPDICVHALVVALELLEDAYNLNGISCDDIRKSVPGYVERFITGGE